jgi:hypothetical protein
LARIVQEREIHKTKLGAIVITRAADDDYGLVPFSSSNRNSKREILSSYMLFRSLQFMLVMIFIVKPFLKRIGDLYGSKDSIGKPVLAIFLLL